MPSQNLLNGGLLLVNVGLVSCAQLFLKTGASKIQEILHSASLSGVWLKIILNPALILGTFFYVCSLILWVYLLTRIRLSVGYPIMSLSYVTVMIFSFTLFKEPVNAWQWFGATLIVLGTYFIFSFK